MEKDNNTMCKIARCLGRVSVWCNPILSKLKTLIVHYLIIQLLVIAATIAYIEIGHDKGWKRADVWYTCLHTHHHFPWQ